MKETILERFYYTDELGGHSYHRCIHCKKLERDFNGKEHVCEKCEDCNQTLISIKNHQCKGFDETRFWSKEHQNQYCPDNKDKECEHNYVCFECCNDDIKKFMRSASMQIGLGFIKCTTCNRFNYDDSHRCGQFDSPTDCRTAKDTEIKVGDQVRVFGSATDMTEEIRIAKVEAISGKTLRLSRDKFCDVVAHIRQCEKI